MANVEPAVLAEAAELGMTFEEPPPRTTPGGPMSIWIPRLEFLMKNPGVWAKFETKSDAARHQIKKMAGDWNITSRTVDRKLFIFIRYNGPSA